MEVYAYTNWACCSATATTLVETNSHLVVHYDRSTKCIDGYKISWGPYQIGTLKEEE